MYTIPRSGKVQNIKNFFNKTGVEIEQKINKLINELVDTPVITFSHRQQMKYINENKLNLNIS